MTRLTRRESQAATHTRLLEAAALLFRRDGYAITTIDAITAHAGFSKGAFYSNFDSKEAIFLAVFEAEGRAELDQLIATIGNAAHGPAIVEGLAAWADDRSTSGAWALSLLEHARQSGAGAPSRARQEELIRSDWQRLGAAVLARLPQAGADAETLGALLHEIAYAPALTLVGRPRASDLMRLVLRGLAAARED